VANRVNRDCFMVVAIGQFSSSEPERPQIRSDMGSKLLCVGGRWVGGVIGVIGHCWIGLCRYCRYGLGLLFFFSNVEVRG
jgi:hypothetical protein